MRFFFVVCQISRTTVPPVGPNQILTQSETPPLAFGAREGGGDGDSSQNFSPSFSHNFGYAISFDEHSLLKPVTLNL